MNQTLAQKGSKFIVVGLISTAFNYCIFYVLLNFLRSNYLVASVTGYIFGTGLGFLLNNYWTFGFFESAVKKIIGYCAVYLFSLGLSSLFMWASVDLFHFKPNYMNLLAICLTTITNFIGLNFIIYRR